MNLPRHTPILVRNTVTGECMTDQTCEDMQPGAECICCARGTYRVKNGLHVCEPLMIVGTIQPWGVKEATP